MFSNHPFWQLARFGVVGGLLTLLVSGLYLAGIRWAGLGPGLALVLASVIASVIGFFAHSEISFRGHGARDRLPVRLMRFGTNNLAGFLLNYAFVLVLVKWLHLPDWTPTLGFTFVTPVLSFALNRAWVFS